MAREYVENGEICCSLGVKSVISQSGTSHLWMTREYNMIISLWLIKQPFFIWQPKDTFKHYLFVIVSSLDSENIFIYLESPLYR